MAFDAGPPRIPCPAPFQREPVGWLDVVTRTIGVLMFLGLYGAWLGHQFSGVLKAMNLN